MAVTNATLGTGLVERGEASFDLNIPFFWSCGGHQDLFWPLTIPFFDVGGRSVKRSERSF